jgi:exopolysaccharide biosynthesis WecB/TagA/CpsF family protein
MGQIVSKRNILGVLIDAVDYDSAVERIITAACQQESFAVSALAVHGVMTGVHDSRYRYRLNALDLVVPDGQPVRWALNLLYQARLSDRVYGPRLMLEICEQAARQNLSIYLYGSRPVVVTALVSKLQELFPDLVIAGARPSMFRKISAQEKEDIAAEIRASGAALTFVGLGCPRQEVWVYEYHDLLSMPLIAVGAAFDFHAGLLPQAPAALQRLGLEWFYRFLQEPKRLWRRYILLNPKYLYCLFLQWLNIKKFDPFSAIAPTKEVRYG